MGVFDKEILIFKDIEKEIIPTVISTIKKFDFVLLDYNTNKQMNQKGEDSKGSHIGDYSGGYKRIRIRRGLQVDHVDLHFTGKFQAELKIVTESGEFKIISSVTYADDIVKKYGKNVLGIQQQNLEDFVKNYITPQIKKMINDKLKS